MGVNVWQLNKYMIMWEIANPVLTEGFSQPSPDMTMLSGQTHPPPTSPMDFARSDIMKLKASWWIRQSLVVSGLLEAYWAGTHNIIGPALNTFD